MRGCLCRIRESMIEIITKEVELPKDSKTWRYQYDFKRPDGRGHWWVIDTHDDNKIVYKGPYQDTMIARYNLNKKFYKTLKESK